MEKTSDVPGRRAREPIGVGEEAVHRDTGFVMKAAKIPNGMPNGMVVAQILVDPSEARSVRKKVTYREVYFP